MVVARAKNLRKSRSLTHLQFGTLRPTAQPRSKPLVLELTMELPASAEISGLQASWLQVFRTQPGVAHLCPDFVTKPQTHLGARNT